MLGEMRTAALLHKIAGREPTVLPASELVTMATRAGAGVLGLQEEIGALLPGKKADLIVLELRKPHLTPCYDLDSLLAYAATGSDVRSVVIDGVLVLEERRLLTMDLKETMARVNELAALVRKKV
jgi:5-methylthioadenosine/S-adenosylhomocysteine deaminase